MRAKIVAPEKRSFWDGVTARVPTWSALRGLGESRIVRSASIWVILVPIAANLVEGVDENVRVRFFGHEFALHFVLPFSWRVLFLAAIAFLLANVIYVVRCPTLIRETANFRDFSDQQRSGAELFDDLRWMKAAGLVHQDAFRSYAEFLAKRHEHFIALGAWTEHQANRAIPEIYADVRTALGKCRLGWRVAATILYGIGLAAIGFLILQNVAFVVRHWVV